MKSVLRAAAALLLLPGFLAACSKEPAIGPVEVKWDRDACVRCSMILSDRHYAAQVRGGPKHKAYKFDDLGCAVFWLQAQPWAKDADMEFWVMSADGSKWLDARKAHYVPGKTTPMGYGFGAVELPIPGSVNFDEASRQILAKGR